MHLRKALNNVKHSTDKDCEIHEHVSKVGEQLDPQDDGRDRGPDAKTVLAARSSGHATRPVNNQEDKDYIEPVIWVVQP